MKSLNTQLLSAFLEKSGKNLKGRWMLVGGTLLPAVGLNIRSTVDIDLVGLGDNEAKQTLELMELAEELDLGVEAINQAASFFLNKLKYSNDDLIILHKGPSATIYRPSVHLYWKLKINRLSEADAIDCQHYLQYCIGQSDKVDKKLLLKYISKVDTSEFSKDKVHRLELLKSLLY